MEDVLVSCLPPLNIGSMKEAAKILEGEHDFSAFCSAGSQVKSKVRTIYEISIQETPLSFCAGNVLRFRVRGNGFLYNMVRIIVGTLLEVGMGRRTVESVQEALSSGERQKAGPTAPPQGLTLAEIRRCDCEKEIEKDNGCRRMLTY